MINTSFIKHEVIIDLKWYSQRSIFNQSSFHSLFCASTIISSNIFVVCSIMSRIIYSEQCWLLTSYLINKRTELTFLAKILISWRKHLPLACLGWTTIILAYIWVTRFFNNSVVLTISSCHQVWKPTLTTLKIVLLFKIKLSTWAGGLINTDLESRFWITHSHTQK